MGFPVYPLADQANVLNPNRTSQLNRMLHTSLIELFEIQTRVSPDFPSLLQLA